METSTNSDSSIGAVYDRANFVDSRKNARSQTAPTVFFLCTGIAHAIIQYILAEGKCERCWQRF
jgi:hypothetical protein